MTPHTPSCVGIILDGNRRWAKAQGLPGVQGHREGLNNLATIVKGARDLGVAHLVVYALSTENLKRTDEEVTYYMSLIIEAAATKLRELVDEGVRIRAIGDLALLPAPVRAAVEKVEAESRHCTRLTLWVALAYGGRTEIVAAARAAVAAGQEVTAETLQEHFWSSEMPEPDIIIRPGGEKRLSGFLLWQAQYAELFFLDKMWPDFTTNDLKAILDEYAARDRRLGK